LLDRVERIVDSDLVDLGAGFVLSPRPVVAQ
jgi:hypothetical protein